MVVVVLVIINTSTKVRVEIFLWDSGLGKERPERPIGVLYFINPLLNGTPFSKYHLCVYFQQNKKRRGSREKTCHTKL